MQALQVLIRWELRISILNTSIVHHNNKSFGATHYIQKTHIYTKKMCFWHFCAGCSNWWDFLFSGSSVPHNSTVGAGVGKYMSFFKASSSLQFSGLRLLQDFPEMKENGSFSNSFVMGHFLSQRFEKRAHKKKGYGNVQK